MSISGTKFTWRPVTGGVPQGSIQGPIQTQNTVNGLDDGTQCKIPKLADDTKLGEGVDRSEGFAAIQRDFVFDRLEKG